MFKKEKVTVIMPVYNEQRTVAEMMRRVLAQRMVDKLVVVDDCSVDKSLAEIGSVKSKKVVVLKNWQNMGKGYSVRKGISHVKEGIILIQDADKEYSPEDYPKLFESFKGSDTVVFGTRMVGSTTGHHYILAKLGNKALTDLFNLFYNQHITDLNTCFKLFRKSMLEGVTLKQNGFLIEEEISIKLAKKGYSIAEVPIGYQGRTYADGKKIKMSDGFKGILYLIGSTFDR